MRTLKGFLATIPLLSVAMLGMLGSWSGAAWSQDAAMAAEGKKIAVNRRKGNCLACHQMGDGDLPGNIGPPLIAMQARFPDKAALREQIHDARIKNPNTIMPPFGPHAIISESDIDKITEYVWTL